MPTMDRRRKEFKAALALAGTTAREWCEIAGVTEGHLYQVLASKRESPPLVAKIDAFIERHVATAAA